MRVVHLGVGGMKACHSDFCTLWLLPFVVIEVWKVKGEARMVVLGCSEVFGTLPDWLQILLGVIGFVVALRQWRKICAVTRAEHLREMLANFNDEFVSSTFRDLIDRVGCDGCPIRFYVGGSGNMPMFVSTEYERRIDTMLLTFSSICHELEMQTITEDEFQFFAYQIHRTLEHPQIVKYLTDLVAFTTKRNKQFPFMPLIREGVKVVSDKYEKLFCDIQNQGGVGNG